MLLLFWKALGLSIGIPTDIKWYHSSLQPPRCIVPGELGVSVVNPYLDYTAVECSYILLGEQCNTADVYGNDLVIGTAGGGLKKTKLGYSQECWLLSGCPTRSISERGNIYHV